MSAASSSPREGVLTPPQTPSGASSPAWPASASSQAAWGASSCAVYQRPSSECRPTPSCSRQHLRENGSGLPVVVPEGEFVQVERKIRLRDVVEVAHDASLQERPKAIDAPSVDCAPDVFTGRVVNGRVIVLPVKRIVAGVFFGGEDGAAGRDGFLHEPGKRCGVGVLDHLGDHVTLAGDGSDDGHLPGGSASALALLVASADPATVPVLRLPADVGFINLQLPGEPFEFVVLHGAADSVAHVPRRPVGTASDHAMDLERADSFLTLAHEVDDLEPRPERVIGILEDRSNEGREAVAVLRALLALPRPRAAQLVDFIGVAAGAANPVRPANLDEVDPALVFGLEPLVHVVHRSHNEELYTKKGLVSSAA